LARRRNSLGTEGHRGKKLAPYYHYNTTLFSAVVFSQFKLYKQNIFIETI